MAVTSGAPPLKQLFAKFTVKIDNRLATNILRWRTVYETRYPDALNTPLLGVSDIGFFPKDTSDLFGMLGIDREEFKQAVRQSSIDMSYHVASDEYNLLTVWISHLVCNCTTISRDMKDKVIKALYFMLQVKFFSSVVRHTFPYKATRAIMEATIDSLSDKFDIKQHGTNTWKLVMEKRAELMTETTSANIHYNTIKNFAPDAKVTYVLSDLQTRIRTKIQLIATKYYEAVKQGNSILDSTMTGEDLDGKKIIKELKNSYDTMIESICNRTLNTQQFIKNDYIKIVCALCSNIKVEMMRNVLMQFSAMATAQYHKSKGDILDKSNRYFVGYHILIANIVQCTYRACIVDKVKLGRANILRKAMNLYRSSRVSDPVVQKIKMSIDAFVINTRVSSREATNASIKIALILYIILMSFDVD